MSTTPSPSVRAQILDVVRANPGINSDAISKALSHVELRHICAHLATLTRKEQLTRVKQDNRWRYTASADAPDEVDDDETDNPPAPASHITTHVAQAPRRPGRITAAEAASRASAEEHCAVDLGEPIAAASPADDDALRLTPVMTPGAVSAGQDLRARIDSDGALEISTAAGAMQFSGAQTRQLGEFLMFTSVLWSRP